MQQTVAVTIGGLQITAPANEAVLALLREKLDDVEIALPSPLSVSTPALPLGRKIGERNEDGIHAGLLFDGERFYELILAHKSKEIASIKHDEAMHSAPEGWSLPTRAEALHLFEKVQPALKGSDEAFAEEWYWTRQVHERVSGYAWIQGFGGGDCYTLDRSLNFRVRFVRRKIIQ
jgi:hypothetical protein